MRFRCFRRVRGLWVKCRTTAERLLACAGVILTVATLIFLNTLHFANILVKQSTLDGGYTDRISLDLDRQSPATIRMQKFKMQGQWSVGSKILFILLYNR